MPILGSSGGGSGNESPLPTWESWSALLVASGSSDHTGGLRSKSVDRVLCVCVYTCQINFLNKIIIVQVLSPFLWLHAVALDPLIEPSDPS